MRGGGALEHRSAATLWGIGAYPDIRTDVTVPDRSGRRRRHIAVHRPRLLRDDERAEVDGIPVTTPARTILDLASVVGASRLERAFHEADRLGLLDPRALAALCARTTGRRGVGRLRALLAAHTARAPRLGRR